MKLICLNLNMQDTLVFLLASFESHSEVFMAFYTVVLFLFAPFGGKCLEINEMRILWYSVPS